jgi:hypothetical protein
MAKPRPEKKRERKANGQLPLPTPHAPASSRATRVLPMDLKVGDRLVDETGEREVVSRPYTSNVGKDVHVRVKRVDNAEVTVIRTWSAHRSLPILAFLISIGGCASVKNTPAQDRVWNAYQVCRTETGSNAVVQRVDPDGRYHAQCSDVCFRWSEFQSCMSEKVRAQRGNP